MKPSLSLGLVTVVRVLVPGLVALLLAAPAYKAFVGKEAPFGWERLVDQGVSAADGILFGAAAFVLGLTVALLDDPIYKLYEGLRLWPRSIRGALRRRLDHRVRRLYEKAEQLRLEDSEEYDRIWARLRAFPLDAEGRPHATRPTRLGNILDAYETYPDSRYGMEGVFYFPRLWVIVPKETREEMRAVEGNSEAPLYVSFLAAGFGLVYSLLAITAVLQPVAGIAILKWADPATFVAWATGCGLLAGLSYYLALPLHRVRGEHFKALFDVFKDELAGKIEIPVASSATARGEATWEDKWAYLQYRKIICPTCRTGFPATASECPTCSTAAIYQRKVKAYETEVASWPRSR